MGDAVSKAILLFIECMVFIVAGWLMYRSGYADGKSDGLSEGMDMLREQHMQHLRQVETINDTIRRVGGDRHA